LGQTGDTLSGVGHMSLNVNHGHRMGYMKKFVLADNAVSKNNADYEIGLCAARASSIIHFNF
jgi:hypothetical protein